jgi:hypothetical protein
MRGATALPIVSASLAASFLSCIWALHSHWREIKEDQSFCHWRKSREDSAFGPPSRLHVLVAIPGMDQPSTVLDGMFSFPHFTTATCHYSIFGDWDGWRRFENSNHYNWGCMVSKTQALLSNEASVYSGSVWFQKNLPLTPHFPHL